MNLISRVIYIIGGIIVTLLGLRLLLVLIGASPSSEFVNFIYNATAPLVRPFFSLFNYTASYGASRFELATLVAIVVYALGTALLGNLFATRRSYTV